LSTNNHKVLKLSHDGQLLAEWKYLGPTSLCMDAAEHLYFIARDESRKPHPRADGEIYGNDYPYCLFKMDTDGNRLAKIAFPEGYIGPSVSRDAP